jgi:hypothetical protein
VQVGDLLLHPAGVPVADVVHCCGRARPVVADEAPLPVGLPGVGADRVLHERPEERLQLLLVLPLGVGEVFVADDVVVAPEVEAGVAEDGSGDVGGGDANLVRVGLGGSVEGGDGAREVA